MNSQLVAYSEILLEVAKNHRTLGLTKDRVWGRLLQRLHDKESPEFALCGDVLGISALRGVKDGVLKTQNLGTGWKNKSLSGSWAQTNRLEIPSLGLWRCCASFMVISYQHVIWRIISRAVSISGGRSMSISQQWVDKHPKKGTHAVERVLFDITPPPCCVFRHVQRFDDAKTFWQWVQTMKMQNMNRTLGCTDPNPYVDQCQNVDSSTHRCPW